MLLSSSESIMSENFCFNYVSTIQDTRSAVACDSVFMGTHTSSVMISKQHTAIRDRVSPTVSYWLASTVEVVVVGF